MDLKTGVPSKRKAKMVSKTMGEGLVEIQNKIKINSERHSL